MLQSVTTKPGDKYRSIKNPAVYEALRRQGMSKERAARISNAQAKRRHKTYTLDQLERYVASAAYDPGTADAIARRIPELPRLKGEQIAPGITRIRGNLCNVHGRYGRCPGASAAPAQTAKPAAAKPKRGRARKPVKTEAQRAAERQQRQEQRAAELSKQQALNLTKVGEATDLGDHLANLNQFSQGKALRPEDVDELVKRGLLERGSDGTPRQSEQARVLLNAAKRGDVQGARDAASRAQDRATQGRERVQRQQDAAGKRAARQMDRELAQRQRQAPRQQRQPAKAGSGGDKKQPEAAPAKPQRLAPRKRIARGQAPKVGALPDKPKPKPAAPAKQETTLALAETARNLSSGAELSEQDTQALIRNGFARLNKDGELILTTAGQRAVRQKAVSFMVFKDARGQYRWVAQSSTAYQDRDQEIVSTKALADDVQRADADGHYGPLRWWHSPGLDLGDCDFNAMHGRVLIESGTFHSEAIATKVAQAAPTLEISLGFLHPPTEPDASGVFHHIRRFERSLVPRGKASNRFTAFHVKEQPMEATKVAALKTLGFSDTDIADIEARAAATEKAADDQQTAYKAEDPQQEIVIRGVTYLLTEKAQPVEAEKAPPPMAEETAVVEEAAIGEMPMEEEAVGGLTLSEEDMAAIGQLIAAQLAPLAGLLDMEKKMQGHVQTLMQPYQAQKDASDAERAQEIAALKAELATTKAQLSELLGDQPAAGYRPSQALDNILGADASLLEAVKSQQPGAGPFDDIVQNLFGNGALPAR